MVGFLQQGERAILIHSWSRGDFMLLIGKLNHGGGGQSGQTAMETQQLSQQQIDDEDEMLALENEDEYVVDEDYYADEDEEENDDNDLAHTSQSQNASPREQPKNDGGISHNSGREKQGFINYRGIWLTKSGYGETASIQLAKDSSKSSQKYTLLNGDGNPFGGSLTVDLKNNSFKVERTDLLQGFFVPEAIAVAFSFGVLQTVLTLEDNIYRRVPFPLWP
eukprot:TRINITY_DN7591_c0_g1_i7.p2 TRINITY_DN7591_c0_g1~~TRINITY_DN7591_c0_g1_i7.p2  ORF type:complete len:240 (-),score=36.84 TRINITY_DN7591_c0_g1_i7:72-734(-)